nr:hypothetical protein [Tanacetum cinerariifolium]
MMTYGGEILTRYRSFLQSHHEYVQSTYSRPKGYQEKFASLTGLESHVSRLQRQVAGLNDKLSSFDVAFVKSKAKGKERKKIKSLTKSLVNLHAKVARLSSDLNRVTVLKDKKDKKILHLKATPSEFISFFRGLESHVSRLQRQVAGLNDKLSSFDVAFVKSKAKGKERKKIKSLTKSLVNLHAKVARLSSDLNRVTVLKDKKDKKILHLKATPSEFISFFRATSAGFKRGLSMHWTIKEFVALEKIS